VNPSPAVSAALTHSTKQQNARALNADPSHDVGDYQAEQVREQREQKEQKQYNTDRGAAITNGSRRIGHNALPLGA